MSVRAGIVLGFLIWILSSSMHPLSALLSILLVVLYGHFKREECCGTSHG